MMGKFCESSSGQEIIEFCRQGEPEAWKILDTALRVAFFGRGSRLVARLNLGPEDADDVVQELMTALWESRAAELQGCQSKTMGQFVVYLRTFAFRSGGREADRIRAARRQDGPACDLSWCADEDHPEESFAVLLGEFRRYVGLAKPHLMRILKVSLAELQSEGAGLSARNARRDRKKLFETYVEWLKMSISGCDSQKVAV
jgi:DNA-directed RNA polymerase specialized sigma24 family protein